MPPLDDLNGVQSTPAGVAGVTDGQDTTYGRREELYNAPPFLVFNAQTETDRNTRNKRIGPPMSHSLHRARRS